MEPADHRALPVPEVFRFGFSGRVMQEVLKKEQLGIRQPPNINTALMSRLSVALSFMRVIGYSCASSLSKFNPSGDTAQSGRCNCSTSVEPLLNLAGRGDFSQRCTHIIRRLFYQRKRLPVTQLSNWISSTVDEIRFELMEAMMYNTDKVTDFIDSRRNPS